MKIKKLEIKNFQSHKGTVLEFVDGLNIIVGPTNTGKSSILRALKKVIRNTPDGNNFVNIDETECTINVVTDKDEEVTRRVIVSKGDTKTNEYVLNNSTFEKFGREIPVEINQVFGIPEIEFETIKLDLNFADQLEGPFLLMSPPSLKAKVLGKLTGVDVLDKSIVRTNKYLRQLNNEIKTNTETVETLEKELSEFINIQECEKELNVLNQKLDKVEKDISLLEKLQTLKLNLDNIVKQGKKVKEEYERLKIVDTIFLEDVEKTFILFQKISDLNIRLDSANTEEEKLQIEMKKINSLVSQEIDFDTIEINLKQLEKAFDLKNQLKVLDEVTICEGDIEKLNKSVKTKVSELKLFLEELKICPICEQPISESVIHKIVEEE